MLFKSVQVLIVRGFGSAAAFLLTLIVSNTVEVSQVGLFMYALAIINLLGVLLSFGAPRAIIKVVGANYDASWQPINESFSFIINAISLFGFIVFVFLVSFPQQIGEILGVAEIANILPVIGIAILLFSGIDIFSSAIKGKHKAVLGSTVQSVIAPACFISVIAVFYFSSVELTASNLTLIYTLCLCPALLLGIWSWFKSPKAHFVRKANLSPEFKSSISALFVMTLMALCVQWAGQLATGKYLSTADIAYFASAQRTAILISFILLAVDLVVAPKFANAFAKGNRKELNALSLQSSRLMIAMASPMLLFMLIFPDFLMGLFGDKYIIAAPLLQIIAVGQFFNVITGSVGYLLVMSNHEKDLRNVSLFSGPLAIVLAFVLTKEYDLIGAAYATAIALTTHNMLAVIMVKKRLGFNALNIFRKVI